MLRLQLYMSFKVLRSVFQADFSIMCSIVDTPGMISIPLDDHHCTQLLCII